MKSTGLEYFCEAAEIPPHLLSRQSRSWSYMLDSPEIKTISEFALKQHNTNTNKQLGLVDVVNRENCGNHTRDYVE
ncbi:hypothetical protein FRX31_032645 [Thalictrum thalictroides]|uniref:Uncharacterized protein n=1 Tax=Thalictrum thalictroides TaxID=46969 RepID=A0A7J6UZB6_THATH|nr:hypothetical protein FRX31_032645 [Thalictrum thalictroides]